MACGKCEEAWRIDGHIPDCETERGCLIPPLTEEGARIMAMREKLIALRGLMSPEAILSLSGVTGEDLEILVRVEQALRRERKGRSNNHG